MPAPKWGDHYYDLLFKFVENMEPFVSAADYQAPKFGDHLWDLQFKATHNMAHFTGASGGNPAVIVTAPSGINDFSTLPGGVAPAAGTDLVYFAPRDASTFWTIASGDSQWTVVDKNNP